MKTIFCPACGIMCKASPDECGGRDDIIAECSNGHKWAVMVNMEADTPDGTQVIAFQCDGVSAHALPEAT
jgi:hypothetical protein